MKAKDVLAAAPLIKALKGLPEVRRALRDKPEPPLDGIMLELAAAQMQEGEGQGANEYIYLSPEIGAKVCDFALSLLRDELKKLGVKP